MVQPRIFPIRHHLLVTHCWDIINPDRLYASASAPLSTLRYILDFHTGALDQLVHEDATLHCSRAKMMVMIIITMIWTNRSEAILLHSMAPDTESVVPLHMPHDQHTDLALCQDTTLATAITITATTISMTTKRTKITFSTRPIDIKDIEATWIGTVNDAYRQYADMDGSIAVIITGFSRRFLLSE